MPVVIGDAPQHGFANPIGLLSDCHRRIERFLRTLDAVAHQDGVLDAQSRKALAAASAQTTMPRRMRCTNSLTAGVPQTGEVGLAVGAARGRTCSKSVSRNARVGIPDVAFIPNTINGWVLTCLWRCFIRRVMGSASTEKGWFDSCQFPPRIH